LEESILINPVEGEVGDNNFQIVLKTDKNGLYSQVTQVELGKVTNFTISVKDPCQNAAQVQKTSYSGRSQTSGTIDFIICKSVVGSGCPVKFALLNLQMNVYICSGTDYPGAVYLDFKITQIQERSQTQIWTQWRICSYIDS
jgi:hypothetical protein